MWTNLAHVPYDLTCGVGLFNNKKKKKTEKVESWNHQPVKVDLKFLKK